MIRIAHTVILAWGWSRWLIAFLAGALGALAMPPFGLWPVLAISLTLAVWLIDGSTAAPGRSWRNLLSAATAGWWFGFGFFLAGLWWLGAAFLVEADRFAWLMPFGVVGLPAGLALFFAFGFGLARTMWSARTSRILAFAAAIGISEWLRGHILSGFPWNSFGLAFGSARYLDQSASWLGLYGLTLLAVATCASPATIGTAKTSASRFVPPVLAVIVLMAVALWGVIRLPADAQPVLPNVTLRIMQPNIQQDEKFRPENRDAIMRHYLALSDRATSPRVSGISDVTHLIWPESAFPFLLDRDGSALAEIAALLPPGATLVTGAARAEEPLPGEGLRHFFNAIQVVDDEGAIKDTYDKVHLVPFGEYLPLRSWLDRLGLRQFVGIPGGFEPGTRHKLLSVRGLPPVAPLICYEAIFPGAVVPPGSRPGLLLNVTNDAWFGLTPGPYQHFAQARMRAIEEGLPLVRAANNGISGVIDPYGRVLASLPLGVEGVVDSRVPRALSPTLYARFGDSLFFALVAIFAGLAFMADRRARR